MANNNYEYPFSLFTGRGIELEYMIVDKDTLNILPIADKLLYKVSGSYENTYYPDGKNGNTAWSNELTAHVIEFKTNNPSMLLAEGEKALSLQVKRANTILEDFNAMLMPTSMHPWMDPAKETVLWPHGDKIIYNTFDRIFSCKGHGWSNLQSMHINLPFRNDEEFFSLHAAIRLILPLIPALTASSPFMENNVTGLLDSRLDAYKKNCQKIPSITGNVIPEAVSGRDDYEKNILERIYKDIAPFDPDNILQDEWLNARGCIARFDRGTIEIRIIDIQETPSADFGIARFIIDTLKLLTEEILSTSEKQNSIDTGYLAEIFNTVIRTGMYTTVTGNEYLSLFGIKNTASMSVWGIWMHIAKKIRDNAGMKNVTAETILKSGSLAERILESAKTEPVEDIYMELANCLKNNRMFRIN